MSTTDGRRARGDRRRADILAAGIDLAISDGLDGFSLDALATASRVPKSGIQILFKNKASVQRSIVLAARRMARIQILLPTSEAAPGTERLLHFGERWLDTMAQKDSAANTNGCFFCSVWAELQTKPGPLRDLVAEDRRGWLAGLTAALEHGVKAGQLRSVTSPQDDALTLLGIGMAANAELRWTPGTACVERTRLMWVNQVERFR